jgi:hypothetical protein
MKNRLLVCALVAALLLAAGCVSKGGTTGQANVTITQGEQKNKTVEFVEVIHFHRTSQCWTCQTVGAYAEETVNTYFAEEIGSGKLVFKHLNTELAENYAIFKRYNTTTPSLCIGVYSKDGFHAEENTNVWYKVNDKEDYMTYLKGIIEKRLIGEVE